LPETSIEILTLGAFEARSKIRSRYLLFAMLLAMALHVGRGSDVCGVTFDSHRLEENLVHVPHVTAAQAADGIRR
jgi:hypothetical protein